MKLRSFLVLILFVLNFSKVSAQNDGLNWEPYEDWKSVLKAAQESKRPIFLDLYATWCGPCKWMDKEVYAKDSVGEFFNREFIRVKVQMDSLPWDDPKIKSWYASVADVKSTYKVSSFPTLLFLSPSGEIYKKIEGVRDAESLLKEAKDALNPQNQYATLMKRYETGNREPFLVRELVRTTERLGEKVIARKMAQEYINSLEEKDMYTKDNIWFIYDYTKTTTDRGFAFMANNAEKIEKAEPKMGKIYSDSKVVYILGNQIFYPYYTDDKGKVNWDAIHKAAKPFGKAGEMVISWNKPTAVFKDVIYPFLKTNPTWEALQKKVKEQKIDKDWELELYKKIINYYVYFPFGKQESPNFRTVVAVGNYYLTNPKTELGDGQIANELAWIGFNHFKHEEELQSALLWARIAIGCGLGEIAAQLDTFANLLYKLGRKEEALTASLMASGKAPEDKEIAENLKKIKEGLPTWIR